MLRATGLWRGSKISIFTPYGLAEAGRRLQGCGKKKEGVRRSRTRRPGLTLGQEHKVHAFIACTRRTGPASTLAVRHGVIAAQVTQPAGACSWERAWQGCRRSACMHVWPRHLGSRFASASSRHRLSTAVSWRNDEPVPQSTLKLNCHVPG